MILLSIHHVAYERPEQGFVAVRGLNIAGIGKISDFMPKICFTKFISSDTIRNSDSMCSCFVKLIYFLLEENDYCGQSHNIKPQDIFRFWFCFLVLTPFPL